MPTIPAGDLSRTITHEANDDWPTMIEVVAYWGEGRKGKRCSIEIPADQFFGRGSYGAPLSGDQLIGMVNRLRKPPTPATR
jgi:hypothetical protein